ncbi:MAG: nuclear transport factor 2 family protein [Bdellovibrionaceae bacterium]|nr:nuclear transport factor 2 family protein [Pseudobdellovibrionaceae bacterium]
MKNLIVRPPLPPFDLEDAILKVCLAEDAWNSKNPLVISMAYTVDSWWRNRSEFVLGREAIQIFLAEKWKKELNYRLIKELWAHSKNRISVKFQYEYSDLSGSWFRAYGNENWEFDDNGLMKRREASINDLKISEADRLFFWPEGPRPQNHPGLKDLGL